MRFRPRFSLRTLFIVIALSSVPMAWVAYQLNWIRQRQEFRQTHILGGEFVTFQVEEEPRLAPWSLRLFGERSESLGMLIVQESQFARGRELFPEAYWVVRYGE